MPVKIPNSQKIIFLSNKTNISLGRYIKNASETN